MDALDNKLIVVCGPTATGKTELAAALARRFGGEIVGADSMQVYRGLSVGTAAPTSAQLGGVACHLVGCVPPETSFSVADWLAAAQAAIRDIKARGALPIVCGGTGLYIKSLTEGLRYTEEKPNPALRKRLEAEWAQKGGAALLRQLAGPDPARAAQLHPNDQKRIVRALEQSLSTGLTAAQRGALSRQSPPAWQTLCLGLNTQTRAQLYSQINARAHAMLQAGLLEEARGVWQQRENYRTAAQAIGYKEFFPFFEGQATLESCTEALKQATRNYAKRQLTWFGGMPGVHWLQAGGQNTAKEVGALVEAFLKR